MSCNWYLVCQKCGAKIDFWRYQAGGLMCPSTTAREEPDKISEFIQKHNSHGITVASGEDLFEHLPNDTTNYSIHEFLPIEAFECKHCRLRVFSDSRELKKSYHLLKIKKKNQHED